MRANAVVIAALLLASLCGCWSMRSRQTEKELERGEEQSRAIEAQVDGTDGNGDSASASVPVPPRFAPEADDLEPSGEVVDGVRVIRMTASRYKFEPDRIVVNLGDRVRLEISSEDGPRGIAIWGYDIDRRFEPGKTEAITFDAHKPGQYHFVCPVYCGPGCIDMRGDLYVKDPPPDAAPAK
jgi:cytochrome c oxidase subunit 2